MSDFIYPGACENDVQQHVCNPCDEGEEGRIGSLAAVHKRYYATLMANPDDASVWSTGIQNGSIIIIPDVRGTLSSTPTYEAGYGRTPESYTGRTFKVTFTDPNWKGNHATYNALQVSRNYHVAWSTGSQTQVSEKPATWKPDEPVAEEITSRRTWLSDVEFTQRPFSTPFDTPEGVFDCFTLVP